MSENKIYHDFLLDHLLERLSKNLSNSFVEDSVVILLANMQNRKCIPYEILYKYRAIVTAKLNYVSTKYLAKILFLFAKHRLYYMEPFYEQVFNVLLNDKKHADLSAFDCVYILYAYAKQKLRDEKIVETLMKPIRRNLMGEGHMTVVGLRMLVIALAELEYQAPDIYARLQKRLNLVDFIEDLKEESGLTSTNLEYLKKLVATLQINQVRDAQAAIDELPIDGR
jgi:hypothetical protein